MHYFSGYISSHVIPYHLRSSVQYSMFVQMLTMSSVWSSVQLVNKLNGGEECHRHVGTQNNMNVGSSRTINEEPDVACSKRGYDSTINFLL